MKQTDEIIHLLFQVDKAIHEQLRDAGEKCPLSIPELLALSYIDRAGAASISDMAGHFSVRKSSMSIKIAKLEHRGLVTRNACAFDKRSHSIELTEKARALLRNTKDYVAVHASPLFDILTKGEKDTLITLLKKISHE